MLRVSLVSPPERTGELAARLAAAPGIGSVIVLAGAASRPDGDAVRFDVADDRANAALALLAELGLGQRAAVTVDRVDAELAGRPGRGALHQERAPVWVMVDSAIRAGGSYAPSFFVLLAIAAVIGAVGILTNSQILIVAAMIVGPEYAAIISVAFGITTRDGPAVRDGLLALIIGFLAAIALTLAFGLAIKLAGTVPEAFLAGLRPVADLINKPDLYSVIVAVVAGIAGVVSLTEARANVLIGVFVSVTTIPAAASVGLSVAFGDWAEAEGSAIQLALNVVLLIAVGAAGLAGQRWFWRRRRGHS